MPSTTRERIKSVCESLLVGGRAADLYRSLVPHRGVILGYHNVVSDDSGFHGDGSLHLRRSRFREQLDHLMERYEVVGLDRILDEPSAAARARPRAAITFDDAYCGALELGLEDLTERGLPATFFVSPGLLDGSPFWWDSLGEGRQGASPDRVRSYALEDLRGDDHEIRRWARFMGLPLGRVPGFARCATAERLAHASGQPGITLAPHGWSHRNLTRLSAAELREELRRPLEWLAERFSSVIPWLAYPYGLSDPRVERACREAGYRAAVRIGTGTLPLQEGDRYALPRVSVPAGVTLEGFILRTAGLLHG